MVSSTGRRSHRRQRRKEEDRTRTHKPRTDGADEAVAIEARTWMNTTSLATVTPTRHSGPADIEVLRRLVAGREPTSNPDLKVSRSESPTARKLAPTRASGSRSALAPAKRAPHPSERPGLGARPPTSCEDQGHQHMPGIRCEFRGEQPPRWCPMAGRCRPRPVGLACSPGLTGPTSCTGHPAKPSARFRARDHVTAARSPAPGSSAFVLILDEQRTRPLTSATSVSTVSSGLETGRMALVSGASSRYSSGHAGGRPG